MESLGVESYWSGCMTLTLQPEKYIKKQDFVLAIDLPEEACQKLEKESKLPVIRLSVYTNHKYMSDTRRMKLAKYYLYLYQSARLVVTTRLHATLPCLALGTSVLNIELPNFEPERFGSLRELANHMTLDEFMSGTGDYDINNPKENPTEFLEARKILKIDVKLLQDLRIKRFLKWTACRRIITRSRANPNFCNRSSVCL